MNRDDKIEALTAFLQGDTRKLTRLGRPVSRKRNLEAMSDAELIALIEAGTGQPAPDYEAMSDEELDEIINRAAQ